MTKAEMLRLISSAPDNATFFVRQGVGDDAWPATAKCFHDDGTNTDTVYLMIDKARLDEHRNYPEGYSRSMEVPLG